MKKFFGKLFSRFREPKWRHGKLSTLLKNLSRFEVDVRTTADPHVRPIYIRDREHE